MRRKSPQEKKRDSYLKDGRNGYGEHDKGSRKKVRLRKRATVRSNRHAANMPLLDVGGSVDDATADAAEGKVRGRRQQVWKKSADCPLGEYVINRLDRRVGLGIDAEETAVAKIQKVQATVRVAAGRPPGGERIERHSPGVAMRCVAMGMDSQSTYGPELIAVLR